MTGVAEDISQDGSLLVRTRDRGMVTLVAGEVERIRLT